MLVAFGTLLLQVLGREHDDGDVRCGGVGLQLLGELQPVHHRHHHIADDQVGHFALCHLQSFLAVGSLEHHVTVLQE